VRVAVDTSVLLDVLTGDRTFGLASRESLRRAYDSGNLVACDVVWAEVRAIFDAEEPFENAMEALGVEFLPTSRAAALLAGRAWRTCGRPAPGRRVGARTRIEEPRMDTKLVADLLVGAHARLQADALLARDRGYFRTCFKGLKLLEPKGASG
jgi:predicted nucleic acid-binding protein